MILSLLLTCAAIQDPPAPDAPTKLAPSFEREVRPLLMALCSGCHQPALLEGNLDLTTYAGLMHGTDGETILNTQTPDASALLEAVLPCEGLAPDMPPDGPALDAIQINLLRRWIAAGAPDDTLDAGPLYSPESPPVYTRAPVITSIAHSVDGSLLAVSAMNETLLYDTADLTISKRLVGLSERITSVRFSPDGTRLAVGGGTPGISGELQLWDIASTKLLWSRAVTHDTIRGLSFSPDGSLIACGGTDNTLRAMRTSDGVEVLYQASHADWVLSTDWSQDGSHLLSVGRDRSLKLIKVETQQFIDNVTSITPGALRGGLLAVRRHPSEEQVLIGGADGAPQIYRIFREKKRVIGDNYNLIRAFDAMPGRIYDLAWGPDGATLCCVSSTGRGGTLRAYTTADGAILWEQTIATGQFTLSIHPTRDSVICGGADGILRRHKLTDGTPIDERLVLPAENKS
jgi:WD40 repeat protein